jgi:DNA-binding transcriptional MerR regulator
MVLRIGALAQRTGVTPPTIRFYEEAGLLPRPDRSESGQRGYAEADVRRLTFIRRCRDFGFSIDQVRTLLTLTHDPLRSCSEARDLAQQHLNAIRDKLTELRGLERSLATFVQDCDRDCPGGPAPDCVILGDLAVRKSSVAARSCGQCS